MPTRIILVDDEPDLLKALSVRLGGCGYLCESAAHGAQALEKIRKARPDLILTDLLMPGIDGYELCRILKADPSLASIPVIVLTAVPERAFKVSPQQLGVAFVAHKPFDSPILVRKVKELLAHTPAAPAASPPTI